MECKFDKLAKLECKFDELDKLYCKFDELANTFGNHVLRLGSRVAVKLNFRPYIRRYTSPNENFEYIYPLIGSPVHS